MSESTSKRFLFDQIAHNVITYLEGFDEICEIEFNAKDSAQSHEFLIWERKNAPFKLPPDLKSFYSIFNGISIQWKVNIANKRVLIGEIKLNSIDAITRQTTEGHSVICESNSTIQHLIMDECTVFQLDGLGEYGQVLLVYRNNQCFDNIQSTVNPIQNQPYSSPTPEIWFMDMSSRWHYLCSTFTHFMRICVLHLGIIGWQLAYTPEGLPDVTQQWMRLFCKERLCIDFNWQSTRKNQNTNEKKRGTGNSIQDLTTVIR